MKLLLVSLLLSASTAFAAKTTLELPLTGYYYLNNKEVKLNIPQLNKKLKAKGVAGLPEVIVIRSNPRAFHNLLTNRAQAASEALGQKLIFNVADEGYGENYLYNWENICYRGAITEVPQLINSMLGNFLNPDQGILAIGAGSKKEIFDDAFKSREGLKQRFDSEYETNLKDINMWLGYKANSKTALVMSDLGPQGDGTELYATQIPPCK